MKLSIYIHYFLLCCGVLFLIRCSVPQKERYKIGLLMDNFVQERWKKDRNYFLAKAKQLNADVIIEAAQGDENLQLKQAEKVIKDNVQAIIVVPVNSNSAAKIVQKAHANNIKVIAYDRLIKNCDLDYYISTDNIKIGEMQAAYMTDTCPNGNYILIGGVKSNFSSFLLKSGQMNALQPFVDDGRINIIYNQHAKEWTKQEGYAHMKYCFSVFNPEKIDVVIAANDNLASGVIKAIEEIKPEKNILIAGQDADLEACRRIVSGKQTMTVYKPIRQIAEIAAEAAVALAKGEVLKNATFAVNNNHKLVASILFPAKVVDKNTMEATVIKDNYLKREQIYENH